MKDKLKITTDKALIFSAIMITIFTITMVIIFCLFQSIPDSLVVAFFGAFACEGGFCTFIHRMKKKCKSDCDSDCVEDICDEGNLVIDLDCDEREE